MKSHGLDFFNFVKTSNSNKAKFIRYVVIGGSAACLDFSVFFLLFKLLSWSVQWANPHIILGANTAGILSGFVWGFFLQKMWAFKAKGQTHIQFFYVFLLLIFNILITSFLIAPLALLLNHQVAIAKMMMQVLVVLWNYLIYNFFIFKDAGVVDER